jgi:hypothetical protein
MAEIKQRPSWMVPAVVGAFILAFIAIALTFGSLSRPGGRSNASSPTSPANAAGGASAGRGAPGG